MPRPDERGKRTAWSIDVRLRPHGRLGLYELEARVSEGGLGEVWKAHHTTSGRLVALRILPNPPAGDPFRFARFEHDVAKLTALRHVNIAKPYEFVEAETVRALVYEWVSGESLASRLARGPIPIDEAVQLIEQVAKGLAAAHARDLVHGDVKPSNIVLCPNGRLKVLDLGLIENYDAGATAYHSGTGPSHSARLLGAITGTAAYFSPEQILGHAADSRSDVWAFGCVLYEVLTGRPAFAADDVTDTMAMVSGVEPEWTLIPPATPLPLVDVLHRCLKKDPAERFQRLTDVLGPMRMTTGDEEDDISTELSPELEKELPALKRWVRGRLPSTLDLDPHALLEDALRHLHRWPGPDVPERYRDALQQLSERDRALIESRLEKLDSYDDIASRFSLPTASAARVAVARAMRRLADLLAKIRQGG